MWPNKVIDIALLDNKLEHVLNSIIDTLLYLTGAEYGLLFFGDENGLRITAARNADQTTLEFYETIISKTLLSNIAETKKPLLIKHAMLDPMYGKYHSVTENNLRSIMAVPIYVKDDFSGVIYVGNNTVADAFSEHDLEHLCNIAFQAQIAIEQAFLYAISDHSVATLQQQLEHKTNDIQEVTKHQIRAEAQLEIITEQMPAIVWATDHLLNVTQLMGDPYQILSADIVNIIGRSVSEVFSQNNNHNAILEVHDRALKGEQRVCSIKLGKRFYQINVRPLKNAQGEILGCIGIAIDISQQKEIERAEYEQRILAETLRDTVQFINSTLDFREILERILAYVGQLIPCEAANVMLIQADSAHIIAYQGRADIAPELDPATMIFPINPDSNFEKMLHAQSPLLIPDVCADERWIERPHSKWVRTFLGTPICVREKVVGFLNLYHSAPHVFNDIHSNTLEIFANQIAIALQNAQQYSNVKSLAQLLEQKIAQKDAALTLEQDRLQIILDSVGEAILYIEDGVIQYANQAVTTLTGYQPDEILGKSVAFLRKWVVRQGDVPFLRSSHEQLKQNGHIARTELPLRTKDGLTFDAALTISLVAANTSHQERSVVVIHNASPQKALDAKKHRFLVHVAHELRNPLANIQTRLDLIRLKSQSIDKHLQVIGYAAEHLQVLANDILDTTRFEQGLISLKCEKEVVQDIVQHVILMHEAEAERHELRLVYDVPDAPIVAVVDRTRLIQVLSNLLVNAIANTPADGTISLTVRCDNSHLYIDVEDTGTGIDPADLPYIFDPFFKVSHGSLRSAGLGLTIVQEILHQHSGTIAVRSLPGQGSCFTLSMPVSH